MPAKKAGTASLKSLHSISLNEEVIITPTATRAGAVAANGTALTKVARKADTAEADGDDYRSESCTSSRAYTGGAFNESRCV